jgi:hypothetical protein
VTRRACVQSEPSRAGETTADTRREVATSAVGKFGRAGERNANAAGAADFSRDTKGRIAE